MSTNYSTPTLSTDRTDELVDFIAACHDLPRPVKVVFDVALGHADNRSAELLSDRYILGPGWEPALVAPGVAESTDVELDNGQAIVWRREP